MSEKIADREEIRYIELQNMALNFAREGKTEELYRMIDAGMPVDLADAKGQSLLMLASYNGHFETTEMLLNNGAEVDRRNDRGQTPLGGVAFKGYSEIAGLLLEHGADVFADNGGGMAPAHYASMFGRFETYELLKSWEETSKRNQPKKREAEFRWMPELAGWIGAVQRWIKA